MNTKAMGNLRKRWQFRVAVLLLMALAAGGGCVTVKVNLFEEAKPLKEKVVSGYGRDKILLMDISGLMVESPRRGLWGLLGATVGPDRVKEELEKARQDDRIKALVLRINSPGGTVSAADMIHHELLRFKEERRVPVVACFMGLAASGGYYVAQAADEIVAHPTTLTGSIGVVAMKLNLKGLLDKVGVEPDTVKSGRLKDFWSPFKPASEEEKRLMQAIIDDFYDRFVGVVEQGRQLNRREVKQAADGRLFTAAQARSLKLVDRLGYLEDALKAAQARAGLSEAKVVMYHRPDSHRPTVYSLAPELLGEVGPQFFYLWGAAEGL